MSEQETGRCIPCDDQLAVELRSAVHAGDVAAVRRLLHNNPVLATARLGSKDSGTATPLHLVTDWPGYFPNGPQIVRVLIDAGADPNALTTRRGAETTGPGDETPLHYAASSDDADVARSGTPAPAGSAAPRSTCCHAARTSTGNRTTPTARRWTPPPAWAPGRRNVITWLRGLGARSANSD